MQCTTPNGETYVLMRKRVKNLNLRVHADGSAHVSAPSYVSRQNIDAFVDSRTEWLEKVRERARIQQTQHLVPCNVSPQDALLQFTQISDAIFPLFENVLGGQHPVLKVRQMKTRWGVCNIVKKQITLNLLLAEKPKEAIEYVILHEYAHFIQANHSPAFWAVVAQYMPDYKMRRALLKT